MHALFVAIIRLINFFCETNEKLPILKEREPTKYKDYVTLEQKYNDVCDALDHASRETALFNCLEVPNDHVRLEVVKCLYNVPLSQYSIDEEAQLIKMIGT